MYNINVYILGRRMTNIRSTLLVVYCSTVSWDSWWPPVRYRRVATSRCI